MRHLRYLLLALPLAASAQSLHLNVLISAQNNPNETAICINPKNTQQLVAGANINNAYTSLDGGLTWTRQALTSPQVVWGDPTIVCDTTGAFLFSHLTYSNVPAPGFAYPALDRMQVQRAPTAGQPFALRGAYGLNPNKQQDKGWLAVNRRTNALYSTWTEFDTYGSLQPQDSTRILFSRSLDGGQIWSTPRRISRRGGDAADESNTVEGAVPAVGPNGELYVSWAGPQGLVFNRSLDDGLTWLPQGERLLATQPGGWAFSIAGLDRSNGLPVTDCDRSRSPYRGTIYVNWTDQRNGLADTDVWLASSPDGGTTWTAPRRVNNDPAGHDQFLTWMTVDQATGHLWFVFYDRRNYPASSLQTDVYGARSTDGGRTFQNFRLSQTPFSPDANRFLGDYINITAHNNVVRPIWTRMDANRQTSAWTALVDVRVLATGAPTQPLATRLQAYPNPASDVLHLALQLPVSDLVSGQFRTLAGQTVRSIAARLLPAGAHDVPLSVAALPVGIYLLETRIGDQIHHQKVVIDGQ